MVDFQGCYNGMCGSPGMRKFWLIFFGTGLLLTVILVPLSLSSVEYYEYGLVQSRTGKVDTSYTYTSGRHLIGPVSKFLTYPADSHLVSLHELSVFSSGGSNESIGVSFKVDVDFTYLLNKDEIGVLHEQLASSYQNVIESRAKDAIKNSGTSVPFLSYFRDRKAVEQQFRLAVEARWAQKPSVHCTLDQFFLGRIQIPDTVAAKQLESKVQNERNDMESFLQQAQLEREYTAVEVNTINLEKENILKTAEAEASLLRAKARVQADQITQDAQINGTELLFQLTDILTQDHMTAFSYIRTLKNHPNVAVDVSYLSADNVVRTAPA
jgi:SPFH domain / Band 7 family